MCRKNTALKLTAISTMYLYQFYNNSFLISIKNRTKFYKMKKLSKVTIVVLEIIGIFKRQTPRKIGRLLLIVPYSLCFSNHEQLLTEFAVA